MPSRRSKKGSKTSKNTRHKNAKEHDSTHRKKNPEFSRALIVVQSKHDQSVGENFWLGLDLWYEDRKTQVRYVCGQLEVGEISGIHHFQGYVQLKRAQRMSWWKKNIHPTAKFKVQSGNDTSNQHCVDYCRKSETLLEDYYFKEFGTFAPGQGFRTDIIGAIDAIEEGATELDLLKTGYEGIIMKYPKMYSKVKELTHIFFREIKRELIVMCGWPRKGKGMEIRRELIDKPRSYYGKKMSSKGEWFNGYSGEKVLIIQEFEGGIDRARWKDIFDPWEDALVELKGYSVWMCADVVYITSNVHPMHWWKDMSETDREAIKGRITEIRYFSKDAEVGVPTDIYRDDRLEYFLENPHLFDTIMRGLPASLSGNNADWLDL